MKLESKRESTVNLPTAATRVLAGDQLAPTLRLCGDTAQLISPGNATLGGKELVLLAYLRLEPGPHSREKLTALLWGEYPEEKARASFRQALKHLRDAVGDAVEVGRSTVCLSRDAIACDAAEFLVRAERIVANRESAMKESDLKAALAIDVPRFLSSLTLRKSPAFDEWASGMRARLLRRYLQVLATAVRDSLARHAWDDSARLAERWTALAPFDDEPVASLMEAQFLGGNPADALATYTDHATRLAVEVHRAPGQSLIELAARIRREARVSPQTNGARPADERRQTPSFTGRLIARSSEWDALTESWEQVVHNGATRVVLIEGEHGSGKTRLAGDFLRWVATRGGIVLRAAGHDARSGAPFGAVIEALRSGLGAPGVAGADPESLAQVARVLPELRRRFPGLPDANVSGLSIDSSRLFEAMAEVVMAIADESPMTIFVDDLQWCDPDSCSLIRFLIRRTSEVPVLWCITFTAGEVARDAPPARLHRALRITSGITAVPLRPLTELDVWDLIRDLGRIDSPTAGRRLAARLHAVTAGNPFYVIELLKTLFARRLLAIDSATGAWVVGLADGKEPTAPLVAETVQDAIGERVEGLPDELQVILATIAVARHGCGPEVLSHAHGISRLRASILGDALVERHLVVEENGRYCCAHPILAHVVRSGMSSSRRRETHRALALSLELILSASPSSERELGEIALHAKQGDDRAMAYRYSLLAAEACSRRIAYEEALSWLDLAANCAQTTEESQIVGRHVTAVLERAGLPEVPIPSATSGPTTARVDVADLDLPRRG